MSRERIENFDLRFAEIHRARRAAAKEAGDDRIYQSSEPKRLWPVSIGLHLIRSAAVVEQMINGITVRLWDDPFEWTLQERLSNVESLIAYFDEVETARSHGFEFLQNDIDLERSIPAPVELKTLEQLLAETLDSSVGYISRAKTLISDTSFGRSIPL